MKNTWIRTACIVGVLIFTFIYVYPTVGWLCLSEQTREAKLKEWKTEDSVYQAPNFFRDAWKGLTRWVQFDRTKVVNLGLDLQGGIHIVLSFDMTPELKEQKFDEAYVQEMILQRIRRRINEFGTKEPVIQKMGTNQ
ncbi:MAG: hypothetical protein NTU83_05415, partial [Candidatus Hydrogenedentes bacterium]|nr:hypothetical protein [Candidatus Hydrogenedentota bacterium]